MYLYTKYIFVLSTVIKENKMLPNEAHPDKLQDN